jgi:hypothetical protein
MSNDLPADSLHRRELFNEVRAELEVLRTEIDRISIGPTTEELLRQLVTIERMLEYGSVLRASKLWCDEVEREAAQGLPMGAAELGSR